MKDGIAQANADTCQQVNLSPLLTDMDKETLNSLTANKVDN